MYYTAYSQLKEMFDPTAREVQDTSCRGFFLGGVSPNLHFPHDWGILGG